jgi:hypothetical protein
MQLTEDKIIQLIKKPINGGAISEAISHQARLEMHMEGKNINSILRQVDKILLDPKIDNFKELLRPYTVPLMNEIYTSLFKIHNAKGRASKWVFKDGEREEEFDSVISDSYDNQTPQYFYENKGFNYLMSAPNTVILTDLPKISTDENGRIMVTDPVTNKETLFEALKPYNTAVPISVQHDISIRGGAVQYLITRTDIIINEEPHEKYFIIELLGLI